jgi:hypothetical protein
MHHIEKTTVKLAPVFDLEAEAAHIMSIPCSEAMPLIWRLHRMLKKSANELPPMVLVQAVAPAPAQPEFDRSI